jgi:hypothetical protein
MKRIFIYNLLFLLTLPVNAQDVTVRAEYPSVVEAGQQFGVSWTVNAGGGEFSAPSFAGFSKLMGPQTSYSDSRQFINGKWSHEISYTYVYYLQAVREGKYTIPPAVFTLKNKTWSSDSLHIEVTNSNVQPRANAEQSGTNPETNGKDIFLDLSLNRKDVYIGEYIVATIKILTRVNLSGINEIKYPAFNEFLKTDLETPPLNSLKQESINGTIYVTGLVTIDPVQINVLLQQKVGQNDPFFGDFFSNYQSVPRAVASKPVTINVRPLPGIKPADFSGIVGIIKLKADISKDSVNVNDAVNYKITVSGSGNLKLAAAPVLKLSPDIEVYDPKITDNLKNNLSGTSGQKTFDFLLIPRHYGEFTIPPVTYSYFNTSSGKYERFTTEEFHIHARKGSESAPGITVYGGVSKEDVKYVGKDIRFIKTDPGNLSKSANIIISKRSFASSYAIALLAFLTVLFVRRQHIRRNSDLTVVKNRKAGKVAVKRLSEASACLKRGEVDRFHEEILKSIWGYLSDKLNIPVSELTRNTAVISLTENGIGEDKIISLTDILDKCEYARYAPSSSGTEAQEIYEAASRFIRSVENSIG